MHHVVLFFNRPFTTMAYNEELEARVTAATTDWGTTRKKMFGGTAHLLNGNMLCGVYKDYLGPVNTHLIDALLPQMGPGKTRGAQFGYSKSATSNTAWPHLGRNPVFDKYQGDGAALARYGVATRLCGLTTPHSLRLVSRQSSHRRVDLICVSRP